MPAPLTELRGGTEIIRLAIPADIVDSARLIADVTERKLPAVLRDLIIVGLATTAKTIKDGQ